MKKKVVLIIIFIMILILLIPILIKLRDVENNVTKPHYLYKTGDITTALTLEDEIDKNNNTIWCGTFQLIWNDLKNDLAKQDIIFEPQLKIVENLNKETFTTKDLTEKYYYKKIGTPSLALKEEIEKAMNLKIK